ncbi:hypothetical protein [Candidatus Nardonella dryophthoridicola]|uniref:phenylalanine--tRNA ligase n=1 Tax=endosymbiont of Rhynchophorus ferrugineus TaxID=1972133 RepID=A0A2Z5TH52_9GAMM|nr:hypothetical protein [Candidatus Nardonella dryophthoridicola]BBA85123.1 phenylalanine--tRNA ligase beta subunit [endosymbiont of Rhynchophorus ferrugineus]
MKINIEWINEFINYNFSVSKIKNILIKIGIEINNEIVIKNKKKTYKLIYGILKYKKIKNNIMYLNFIFEKKNIYIKEKYNYIIYKNIEIEKYYILIDYNNKKYLYYLNNNIINYNKKFKNELNTLKINDYILDINIPSNKKYINSIYMISKEIINFYNITNKNKINLIYKNKIIKSNFKYSKKIYFLIKNNFIDKYIFKIIKNIKILNITPLYIQERLIKNNIELNKNCINNIINYIILETGIYIDIIKININNNIYIYKNINYKNNLNIIINNNKNRYIFGNNNFDFIYKNNYYDLLIIFIKINENIKIEKKILYNYETISIKKIINKILNIILSIKNEYKLINNNISRFIIYKYKKYNNKKIININLNYIHNKIGFLIKKDKITYILQNIDLKIKINKFNNNIINIYIPCYKKDLNIKEDIIEEIIKYNLNNLKKKIKVNKKNNINFNKKTKNYIEYKNNNINIIKNLLINRGYNEIITNSLINRKKYINNKKNIFILNSNYFLRKDLVYGLIKTLAFNLNKNLNNIKIFEIGNCYSYIKKNINKKIILSGIIYNDIKNNNKFIVNNNNIFHLKGDIEDILELYNIDYKFKENKKNNILLTNVYSYIKIKNKNIGYYGYINEKILNFFKINKKNIIIFKINLSNIIKKYNINKININNKYVISKYQIFKRDISVIIDNNIETNDIIKYCINFNKNIIEAYIINDNEKLINNKNIITLRIIIQLNCNFNKILIDNILINLVKNINKKYNIILK